MLLLHACITLTVGKEIYNYFFCNEWAASFSDRQVLEKLLQHLATLSVFKAHASEMYSVNYWLVRGFIFPAYFIYSLHLRSYVRLSMSM